LYQYDDHVFAPCGSWWAISLGLAGSVKSTTVVQLLDAGSAVVASFESRLARS
jgi:hypothetical protein